MKKESENRDPLPPDFPPPLEMITASTGEVGCKFTAPSIDEAIEILTKAKRILEGMAQ
jgi:hypothetical protein